MRAGPIVSLITFSRLPIPADFGYFLSTLSIHLGILKASRFGATMAASDPTPTDDAEWEAVERELDGLIADFHDGQIDVAYQRAQDALRDLVGRLDLSPRERAGLEAPLQHLSGLLTKLEQSVIQIAVFGLVGRGKSSLLNALVGQNRFETGPTHGITQAIERVEWQVGDRSVTTQQVSLGGGGHSRIELIDTPGLDEVDGETRAALAQR
ncbi:hypothetical protein C7271_13495, partial [filamentous cyanobacterium CCP5]